MKNIEIIDYVLRQIYPLQSIRLKEENDNKISMIRDNYDNTDFTLEDMKTFAETTIPDNWEIEPNSDYCIDVISKNYDFRPTKEDAANELGKLRFDNEKFIITNIGDKTGDVFIGPDTIFFPQTGSQAHEYCIQKKIPCVPIINTIDYFLTMAGIVNKNTENTTTKERIKPIPISK